VGKVKRNRSTKNSVFTGLLEQVESYTTSVLSAQSVLPSPQLQPSIFLFLRSLTKSIATFSGRLCKALQCHPTRNQREGGRYAI